MSVWNGKETMNLPGFVRGTSGLSDVLGLEGTCCGSLGTGKKKRATNTATIRIFWGLILTESMTLKNNTCLWDLLESQKLE